ncbi:MAG: HAD family hydrolase [Pseudomonadota bacterium]|nr:HAD family hydrolase [Pseudomonadota bacterium]
MQQQIQPENAVHRIRAITLDLDDTLWEIGPVICRAEEILWSWLDEHYPRIHEKYSASDLTRMRRDVVDAHRERNFDFRFLRKKVLEMVAIGAGYSESLVEPAFGVFDDARNEVEIYPDVLVELERLSSRFTVVALTNGNSNLETIGIRHLFHSVVTATDVGVAKPNKRIFDVAVGKIGVAPGEILHVGDDPETDIDGARQAGFRTAWINRNGDQWPADVIAPDAIVNDMTDLRKLLEG